MSTETTTPTLSSAEREAMIARLTESKRLHNELGERVGFESGRRWARDVAEWVELDRLDRWNDSSDETLDIVWERGESGAYELWQVVCPGEEPAFEEWRAKAFGGDEELVPGDVRGFIAGAIAAWREVMLSV
jgi:hypothetical protein